MKLQTAAAVVALVLAGSPTAAAQVERGELRLHVSDTTGLPLRATGTLASEAPQLFRAFSTDDRGGFTLQNLPFGVYRLIIERSGFSPYSEVVDVRSAVPRTLQVQLTLAPMSSQVVVTGDPPLVDASRTGVTFSISAPQIQDRLPAVPGRRLLDIVDAQPGWLMEANGVLHPRGSEYQTLFVIDGVPMDENRSPAFAPDAQDGDVQAVTVLTGNFPAEYGRKLGGVVEVATVRDIQEGFHGSADAGGGSFGTASGSFSGRYGWSRRAVNASGSAARTNRYLDAPVAANFTNDGTLGGVTLSYEDRPSDSDRLHLTWHHRQTTFLVPNEQLQEAAGQRQQRTGDEDLGQASWTRIFRSRLVFNARGVVERLSSTLTSNPRSTPVIVAQNRALTRGYANTSLAADMGRHQLKAGGDVVFAPVEERLSYDIVDPSFFNPDTPPSFRFADSGRDREQSLFAQDTLSAGPFTVSAGLRWDRYDFVVKASAFSPRLGLAWSAPSRDLVLRASYDRVFQTPAAENLLLASAPAVEALNPISVRLPVQPSHGHFIEGGLTAGIARKARLDVTAYRRTFTNFADDDVFLNTGLSFPVAFRSAAIRGMDAKLTVLPWRTMSGFASYSLLEGTARLPLVGGLFLGAESLEALDAAGELPITQDQRHTLRAQVRWDVAAPLWITAAVRVGSGLPVELDRGTDEATLVAQYGAATLAQVDFDRGRVHPSLVVDTGFGARVWRRDRRRLTVRAEIANLADRLNVINFAGLFSGTALGAPRSATVRLQYEF
jgi:hypothetical protein